ncbi:ABC transporter permease [Anaerobium acetethylicum]|uniref:Putative aldouronate transport system permease protein n=1 Tax=Anaerobium acetethylicum TaxID=1619234 RepID=A0A1D3TWP8_9FIRM|nr:ABC transporter permease subunit [Anaerobium acetethylicum]SCP98683.1 putative aldouronate transport system permease protein [Anaerobium acetethylicum]
MEQKKIKKKKGQGFLHWLPFYLMGLPGLAYLFINNYMPLVGLQIAFKKFNYAKGMWDSEWSGFKNFEFLFKTKDAFIMIRNTICYNIVWIILGMVFGVTAAILLNEVAGKKAKKFYQTAILLPYLMSMVIIAYLVYAYLSPTSGLFTKIIERITGNAPEFYQEAKWWPFILTFVNQWKGIGFGMILYLSSIIGIDTSYYEAAQLDGATKWQQHRLITLPLLKPTIIMLLILSMGQIFRSDFGLFYQVPMHQGVLNPVTQTIDTYVYNALLKVNDVGMSSAASFIQSVVGFIFIVVANKIVSKADKSSALF